jgi:hypothetical protein
VPEEDAADVVRENHAVTCDPADHLDVASGQLWAAQPPSGWPRTSEGGHPSVQVERAHIGPSLGSAHPSASRRASNGRQRKRTLLGQRVTK